MMPGTLKLTQRPLISSLVTEGNLELYRAMPGELKNFFVNLYDSVNEYGH